MQPIFYSNNSAFDLRQSPTNSYLQSLYHEHESMLLRYSFWEFKISEQLLNNQESLARTLSSTQSQQSIQSNIKPSEQIKVIKENLKSDKVPSKDYEVTDNADKQRYMKGLFGRERLRKKPRVKYEIFGDDKQVKLSKSSETKNVIKNFLAAIINFIKKQQSYLQRISQYLGYQSADIIECVKNLQGKIITIQDLRNLWCEHQYAKFFRMVCENFMRKRHLAHIFNSRVLHYKNHLKYRKKILKSLSSPSDFRNLKDF